MRERKWTININLYLICFMIGAKDLLCVCLYLYNVCAICITYNIIVYYVNYVYILYKYIMYN